MSLLIKIQGELTTALKSKNEVEVSTLRLLISDIQNAKSAKGEDLDDSEVLAVITKNSNKNKESIEAYEKAHREDLADKERVELVIL